MPTPSRLAGQCRMTTSTTCLKARLIRGALVAAFYLVLWQLAATLVGQPLLVPSPVEVLGSLYLLIGTVTFWQSLVASMGRVVIAFLLGVALGVALAVATIRWRIGDYLIAPLLSALRATPVSSFIILALVWMGAGAVPVFTGMIMTLPIVWGNVSQGIGSLDPAYEQMARVFALRPLKRLRYLYLPQIMPAFATACTTSLGLTWKAVIAAEVLGTPKLAMGSAMYSAKIYLETADLFAWTLVVILLSVVFERIFAKAMATLTKKMGWEGNG